MSTTTTHGGRMARLLDDTGEAWYHVYNRIACDKDEMPLSKHEGAQSAFIRFLKFYSSAYCCELATYTVMGNHYHLIVRMKPYERFSREALKKMAEKFYPNTIDQTNRWSDSHWEQFNQRLFSLADLMRNIQQGFARWYNKSFGRRGRFWADRFKSTLLYGEESLLECMQYVDLNPIRAGLVERPEDYDHGAFSLRAQNEREGLYDIRSLLTERSYAKAFEAYRALVYVRGSVASKERQATIKESVMDREMERNFDLGAKEEKRDHFRFYIDGLVLGARDKVEDWLNRLKESGIYLRRKNPVPIREGMSWFAIREQRSHYEG
jgi:REP element-mobilizing transposase RayT